MNISLPEENSRGKFVRFFLPNSASTDSGTSMSFYSGVPTSTTLPALIPNESSPSKIYEADYDRVMAIFEELEPSYGKTNQILANL